MKLTAGFSLRAPLVWFLVGSLLASSYFNVRLRAQLEEQRRNATPAKLEPVEPATQVAIANLGLSKRQLELIRGCSMT